jgi:FkbM family methyltransferase
MPTVTLPDGTQVDCLVRSEALVLDQHVHGYLAHGVELHDEDIIFDIGANVGIFAVRMLQRCPKAKVYAFEPIPEIHAVLTKNGDRYGKHRLVALQRGVSDKPGTMSFDYYPRTPALSTAYPEAWDNDPKSFENAVRGNLEFAPPSLWYAKLVPKFLSGTIAKFLRGKVQHVKCELCTISQIIEEYTIPRIDLLKIDCEGAELGVLLGIKDEHWARIRQAVIETHDTDGRLSKVTTLLREKGFSRITVAHEDGFEKTSLRNVFAVREEKTSQEAS